jgi:hypothetical protein
MSRATDFLRTLGMSPEQITKIQAELDQAKAEADHLIDHAQRLHRGTVENAAIEGILIRNHIVDHNETQLRGLFSALLARAGELACAIETLSADNNRLTAALAVAQGGEA